MPFVGNHANDIALETPDGPVCVHDSKNGVIKSGPEIFEGGVQFFLSSVADGDRGLAERLTRKNMKGLAYWQAHPFAELAGEVSTDKEFGEAMGKL